jgi:hypothetical protein
MYCNLYCMDIFTISSLGLLLLLMALVAWWAFRSYKRQKWVRFAFSVALLVLMGFGWQFFPVLLF